MEVENSCPLSHVRTALGWLKDLELLLKGLKYDVGRIVRCLFLYIFVWYYHRMVGGGYYRNKEQEELVMKYNKTLDDLIELKEKYSRFK